MMDLPDWSYGFALIPRTALRPTQEPYFAFAQITVPAYSYVQFYIGEGFTIDEEWVPVGQRFSIWYACFSVNTNCLIETKIGVEQASNPGTVTILAGKWGFGEAEYLSGVFFDFEQNTRPIYYCANYSEGDITLYVTIFGVVEKIV